MPRSELFYSEMHSSRGDDVIDQLYTVDPLLYSFYLNNKYLVEGKKRGKKSTHELKVMDVLERIEEFSDTLEYSNEEDNRDYISGEINAIHQKIDALNNTTYRRRKPVKAKTVKRAVVKQIKVKGSAKENLLKNIEKMPKYKPMKIKIK